MISIDMTIREAVQLASRCNNDISLFDRIVKALENKCGFTGTTLVLKKIPKERIVTAVRIIRNGMAWELKKAKEFCDTVRGTYDGYANEYWGGKPNSLTGNPAVLASMRTELLSIGCEVDLV